LINCGVFYDPNGLIEVIHRSHQTGTGRAEARLQNVLIVITEGELPATTLRHASFLGRSLDVVGDVLHHCIYNVRNRLIPHVEPSFTAERRNGRMALTG